MLKLSLIKMEKEKYSCDECDRNISKNEYERNKGLCDECVNKIQ